MSETPTVTAIHYDSKSWFSGSHTKDSWTLGGSERVGNAVKERFSAEKVEMKYEGTQKLPDTHNCGRYTLIKLANLLNLKSDPLSLEDINQSLNEGESQLDQETEKFVPVPTNSSPSTTSATIKKKGSARSSLWRRFLGMDRRQTAPTTPNDRDNKSSTSSQDRELAQ